jgi:catechol 2,3-dioxygenase-like lactoylglutathione lyase family enzyme
MRVRRIEHYNIRTTKFADTVGFYDQVLGMKARQPPMAPANSPATWIYDDSGTAAIHLTPVDPSDPAGSYAKVAQYRGGDPDAAFQGSGAIDHIAFECDGFEEIKSRLQILALDFFEQSFPDFNLRQIFLKDPNGLTLELNFHQI